MLVFRFVGAKDGLPVSTGDLPRLKSGQAAGNRPTGHLQPAADYFGRNKFIREMRRETPAPFAAPFPSRSTYIGNNHENRRLFAVTAGFFGYARNPRRGLA
jgi:hypothetical protein